MKKFDDFCKENGSAIVLIFGCLLFGFLMFMCIFQMFQFGKIEDRNVSKDVIPEIVYITLPSSADSITNAKMNSEIKLFNAKMDSTITLINTWNKNHNERLLCGLNDLRQETNNIIDKQNGWLSFWIGILAIVGALIPAMSHFIERKKIDSKLEEVERKNERMKDELNSEIEELTKQRKEIENTKFVSKISAITYTLMECSESIWHINDLDRNNYCQDLLDNLSKTTVSFFNTINNCKKLDPYHTSVKMVLLQLLAAYNACKPLTTRKHKLKQLDNLTNDISAILRNLDKNSFEDYELNHVLSQMKEIQII